MLICLAKCLLLCQLLSGIAQAGAPDNSRWEQLANTVFRHWTIDHGLPHPDVMAIAQDRAGFLWFGTQGGLARWDGYRFRQWQPDPRDAGSVPDNFIQTLFVDARQRLWVGTNAGGLARYDDESDRFVRIPTGPNGVAHVHVMAMADDGAGGLWVGSRGGLDHLSPTGENLGRQPHYAAAPNSLPADQVNALLRDRQGNLWIASEKGLRHQQGKSVRSIDLPHPDANSMGVVSLKQSQDGKIWIGTREHGVFWLNPDSVAPAQALQEPGKDQSLQHATIQAIQEVRPGQLWLGSAGQGVWVVDTQTLTSQRLRHHAGLPGSLADDTVWSMWRDHSGLLWLGSGRGVSQYDASQSAVRNLLSNSGHVNSIVDTDVTSVAVMPDGAIWLGLLTQGIQIINPALNRVTWMRADGKNAQSALPPDRIFAITAPLQGWAYIATDRGLYRANMTTSQVQRVLFLPVSPAGSVRTLYSDGQVLWLGGDDGLWQITPGDNHVLQAVRPAGAGQLSQQAVAVLQADAAGVLWVGTRHNGLYRYDTAGGSLRHFPIEQNQRDGFSHPFVSSILIDKKARLWVGTQGGGINMWSKPTASGAARFAKISVTEGLTNSLVDKLLEDDLGNVWVSTDGGMAVIDGQSLKVRALQKGEGGAIRVYWVNAGVKTPQGELLYGGAGGLTVVRPERFNNWQFRPRVVVSNLLLGGKPISAGSINYLGAGAQRLEIQPRANSLALEFAALDYSAPEQNRYRYRLDGFDPDWIETDATRRLAAYTNLLPGDYNLRLSGSNRNGTWNVADLVVPIRVLPAWHQTWWWYGCELSALLLAASTLVQMRTRYLRQRQNELQSQVWQRTRELSQNQAQLLAANAQLQHANLALNEANTGLASSVKRLHLAQAQLVQQEKLVSLGTLTAGIAHEINNPANFAHVGAYVLNGDLQELQQFLLQLAGDDASPELVKLLQQRFDKLHQSLATISEGTCRIRDLVLDLRTFSRLDQADWNVVAIAESLQATVNLVRTQFASQVSIVCDLAANPELACWPAQLNQVFMNLIVNACQAIVALPAEPLGQRPGLLAIRSRLEGGCLVLEFEDNGCGIAPEHLQKIFDPFFTTKTVGEGMGMGLSISFGIIAKHCGNISVRSVLGQGTCFTVTLPLSQ